jgi:hypothetical protein
MLPDGYIKLTTPVSEAMKTTYACRAFNEQVSRTSLKVRRT